MTKSGGFSVNLTFYFFLNFSDKTKKNEVTNVDDVNKVEDEEENADDPDKIAKETSENVENFDESDEENTIPAPQIKIGANGEIIVDEQSLVIENKETKRNREALQATEIVDGDTNTSYGYYRRMKRPKEWTKSETLRFYKALNALGTDFSVMCELFPSRNRRQLKMKFKREERTNKNLIDKAIMQPVQFNIDELRKELAIELREIEAKKESQEEKVRVKKVKANRKTSNGKIAYKREFLSFYFFDHQLLHLYSVTIRILLDSV